MRPRRSSVRSSDRSSTGFTLAEVLVSLSIASVVIIAVGTSFVWVSRAWTDHQMRLQAQQSLRSAIETINRETRLSGACMPPPTLPPITNNFQPMTGTDGGVGADTITITSNPACAGPSNVTTSCTACPIITVSNVTNFTSGMWAYIYNSSTTTSPPGPYGEYFSIQSVSGGSPGTITVSPSTALTKNYPASLSSVWGADQRTLAISSTCTGCNGIPTLTLQLLGGVPQPLVKGIDSLNIQYVLNRLYSTAPSECNTQTGGTSSLCVVKLPGQAPSISGDWQIVRAIIFALDARSISQLRASSSADGYLHLQETVEVSPRNFIYQQTRLPWTPY